jgi:hypothetical protein
MSKKYIIELEAKVDKATGEVESLKKEIQSLNQQVVKTNKDTSDGIKNVEKATKGTTSAIRRLGASIKQLGLGILIASWQKIQELFGSNQIVLNGFNTAFEALAIAFNDFVNFISNNWEKGTKPIRDFFARDGVQQGVKAVSNFMFELITRIKNVIQGLGGFASAFGKLISGNFSGAMASAQEAIENFTDAVVGNEQETQAVKDTILGVTSAIGNYIKNTIQAARSNVELARTAEINRAINQGLIEQYDRQAEKLRQIRDDDRNTIDERIAANQELAKVLDEQEQRMIANAQAALASAQAQFNINKNDENAIALIEAKNELLAVEAQIEGLRSEQLSNSNALQREQLELTQSILDANTEMAIDQAKFDAEFIQGEVGRLEALRAVYQEEQRLEEDRLTTKKNAYKEGTQAWADANNELLKFQQTSAQQQKKIDRDITEAKFNTVSTSLGQIANLLGENSKFGKALAVTQAIIDTYVGANKAISQGGIFGAVAAAGVIATGIANVKKITATNEPSSPSFASGSSGGSGFSTPSLPTPPSFNVVGASPESQLAQAIGGQSRQPVKAYVVAGEVTTAQSLERNTIKEASI